MKEDSLNKLIAIQILRAVAALMVVVWHSDLSIKHFENDYWRRGDGLFLSSNYPSFLNHLATGVDIFFCISGFIMSMLAARAPSTRARAFIEDRFVRILPPYWFFTAIVIAVYLIFPRFNFAALTGDLQQDAIRIITSFLLVPQGEMPVQPILGPGWTLIHEMLFYYFVTFLIFMKQGQRVPFILLAAAGAGIVLLLFDIRLLYGYVLSPYYIEFCAGALTHRFRIRTSSFYPGTQCTIGIFLYFVISAILDIYTSVVPNRLIQMFGFGFIGFLLMSGLFGLDAKYQLAKLTLSGLLGRIGNASYSLYLSHWLVLSSIGKLAVLVAGASAPFIVIWHVSAITIAVVVAVIFAEYVELPLHKRLSNYVKSRQYKAWPAPIG